MYKIGVFSDTHGFIDERITNFFIDCDEIWHAGDIGNTELLDSFEKKYIVRAVYGNIDDHKTRLCYPKYLKFNSSGLNVLITHIAGNPGRYYPDVKKLIIENKPNIIVCGHSHILKIMHDKTNSLLFINPGAAGNYGFHIFKTALRFEIINSKPANMEILELKRG